MKNDLIYHLYKLLDKIFKQNGKFVNRFFKKQGVNFTGGGTKMPRVFSNIAKSEPWLIFIGDNTTISTNVTFVTHDNSISKVNRSATDLFGEIRIGNNCFIGQNAMILYGVTIPDNVIVAAGAVVTKSFNDSHVIIGGNPATIIGRWSNLEKKLNDSYDLRTITKKQLRSLHNKNKMKLVKK